MRELAARLDAEADALRRNARLREARTRAKADQRARDQLIAQAASMAFRGLTDGEIIAYLTKRLNLTASTAAAVLADERARSGRALRAQRNRLILQLAWKGWTNEEIAADPRIDLKAKTVSGIVSGRLRPKTMG